MEVMPLVIWGEGTGSVSNSDVRGTEGPDLPDTSANEALDDIFRK